MKIFNINLSTNRYENYALVAKSTQHGDIYKEDQIIESLDMLGFHVYTLEYDGYYYIYASENVFTLEDIQEICKYHYSDNDDFIIIDDKLIHISSMANYDLIFEILGLSDDDIILSDYLENNKQELEILINHQDFYQTGIDIIA